jgi:serine/threonine protein kinase/NAD(P)-dependent dehydrogenase (short-subunit alcohol dehydrogenase family)/acyl carrier protein
MSEIEEAFDEKTRRQDPSTIRQRSRARTSRNRPQHRPVTGSSKSRAFSDQSILLNPEQWESIKEKELFQAGTIIQDNYRLEEKIGEGSMGVVWKAADLIQEAGDSRDVYVAIKFLTKDFKRHPNALIKALVREIARYKRLTHSNIVKAYKLSRVGDIIFIVMEFLDGIPLEEFIKQHPNGIPLSQAEPIIRGMGEALAYAHQQGITHLDFKPANVFYDPNKGVTKVMDFSIAQFIEVSDREKTRFKVSELRTPTKAYASCEMLAELVPTPQDDIYALACVTYELLSGKHPFDKTRADQVRLSKELFPPKPIKGLKNKQYKALLRALAFERENRTPTVEEFFEEFFLSKPIVKKSRLAMAAGGIFILLSLAVFVAFSGINQDSSLIECLLLSDEACIKELEPNNLLIDCHPDNRRDLKVSKDPSYCRDDKPGNYFVPSPKEDKDSTSKSEEFQELWNHCPQAMTAAEFYQIQQNRHIHLGPSYQWLDTIRLGNQEAVCQISMPPSVKDADNYQLHPGLIDAGFGLLASAVDMEIEETFVPFSIEKIGFYQHPSHFPLWGHLRMRPASDKNRAVGDIRLFDQSGQIIVDFKGFEGIKAARKALLSGLQTEFNDWFYEIAWQPQPSPPLHPETTGHWLIFADQSGIGLALAERLQKRGSFCTVVYSGKSYEKEAEGRYHVNPAEPLDFQRLLKDNFDNNQLRGIVHLWSLDGTVADLHHAQRLGCASIMHLVQTLVKKSWDQFPRLWLVTRGGQAVPLQVQQTPVWGLGRVIALEHPELDSVCLDLDPSSEDNTQTLFNELWSSDKEAQIVWRQNIRQVARWERRTLPPSENPFSIREDSSYLISGGTGALGLQIAQWLVEQGARHLLLLSRSGVSSSAAQKIIDQIEQTGAKVLIIKVDVADQAALNQALDRAPMPRGIIHAAGVLDDGMLIGQNWDRFENVMAAKVYGAWNLHQRTAHKALDFFIMFSSAASILGNQGQSNYAAANAFLDGLAHYRRNHGLVATTINWGPFAQTGMAASTSSDRLSKQGFKPILPEDGLAVMDRILSANVTQVGAMQCDWHQYVAQFSEKKALFANWVQVPSQATNLLQKINNAPLAEKKKILLDFVLEIIRNVIGIDASQALDTPLMEQGIDSLQAVEMRNRLGKGLETTLPVSLLFNYPTINELINYLEQEVLDEPIEKAQENDKLDDLNDRELEDLINQKLASKFLK